MQKHLRRAALLIVLVPLSACASFTAATVDPGAICDGWRGVMVSKGDRLTEGTARQIEADHLAREAVGCAPARGRAHDPAVAGEAGKATGA